MLALKSGMQEEQKRSGSSCWLKKDCTLVIEIAISEGTEMVSIELSSVLERVSSLLASIVSINPSTAWLMVEASSKGCIRFETVMAAIKLKRIGTSRSICTCRFALNVLYSRIFRTAVAAVLCGYPRSGPGDIICSRKTSACVHC